MKAVVKPESWTSLDEEKKKELRNYIPNVVGGMEEETVYNTLKDGLKNNEVKNTVVVNGWKEKSREGNTQAEFDFFIISEPYHTIFHIEVKSTCTKKNCFKAAEQLDRGLKLIQDHVKFPKEDNWKYTRIIYFGNYDQKHSLFCHECQKFALGRGNDIWNEITKMVEKPSQANPSQTYLNILKFLLYEMFKQESCATTEQLIRETQKTADAITTVPNIFFWSKEQLKVINATKETKRIAFSSDFGTGKTVLLKAKAREILGIEDQFEGKRGKNSKKKENVLKPFQHGQKVVIVIFEGNTEDITLKLEYEKQFQNTDAKIVGIQGFDGNYLKQINRQGFIMIRIGFT